MTYSPGPSRSELKYSPSKFVQPQPPCRFAQLPVLALLARMCGRRLSPTRSSWAPSGGRRHWPAFSERADRRDSLSIHPYSPCLRPCPARPYRSGSDTLRMIPTSCILALTAASSSRQTRRCQWNLMKFSTYCNRFRHRNGSCSPSSRPRGDPRKNMEKTSARNSARHPGRKMGGAQAEGRVADPTCRRSSTGAPSFEAGR
mmetsp:Transcript_100803/g.284298  ORF Transcript_100803/g.284298 Transcript_100803/m.284298 type:complete len:201 (+) Transcript_100803:328-930(+)